MADIQELIARLEAADGITHLLEVEFAASLYENQEVFNGLVNYDPELWVERNISPLASLDAALALAERVLPGYAMNVCLDKDRDGTLLKWSSQVARYGLSGPVGRGGWWFGIAPTPALALCIAILKAKAQGEG